MDAPALTSRSLASVDDVSPADWNALAAPSGVPFVRHEFLAALEHTGCVGDGAGWRPRHVLARRGTRIVGALPLYEKSHSWGEFVFDFGWAQAYSRHGLRYYPKLVSATPFTPATGPRLLVAPGEDPEAVRTTLLAGARDAMRSLGASSLHVQFATESEATWLQQRGLLGRIDCQFHWENRGFPDFEAFLGTFTADKRKKAKRERRRVFEAGIEFEWRRGDELAAKDWKVVHRLHADTFRRHGHEPYLNLAFFTEISRTLPGQPLVLLARRAGEIVATAIFFRSTDTLYGRYWGAGGDYHSLHFEACYHQGIEHCIASGLRRFEPGTQGEHKLARGFAPAFTRSAHEIVEPRFAQAIARFLEEERSAVRAYAQEAGEHVPFRRSDELHLGPPGT